MCGITGYVYFNKGQDKSILKKMINTLRHRGPDDWGAEQFINGDSCIGLGQTRLSIIDTSDAGHQPMTYDHLHIVFNGEIYNYKELQSHLIELGHVFLTNSDTEVILHAFAEWGETCVNKFIGMFAIVIYNEKDRCLYFYRDRAGVKPLFYHTKNGFFLFASELKAFHQNPNFEKEIHFPALYDYFDYRHIASPKCIFKNTYKVEPGHYLKIKLNSPTPEIFQYWSPEDYYKKPKLDLSYREAKEELHQLLKSAFTYRMVSDVPVGVFLSGGYDSTAVAAILQAEQSNPLKTFTIGFESGNNEAPYAKENAKFLGTDHQEYYCTEKEAKDIIPELPFYYDEPFADSSAIPTMLVSRFAKKRVTVALSADGGDEIFGGYSRYMELNNRLCQLKKIPKFSMPILKEMLRMAAFAIPHQHPALKHKFDGLSRAIDANVFEMAGKIYDESLRNPRQYKQHFLQKKVMNSKFGFSYQGYQNVTEMIMARDYTDYLQNDILVKVDRATMATSLEGREPLLDHRILEFAAQLPSEYKFRGLETKRILKDIVHDYVPKEMMDRPKSGFSLPIYNWLQNDLSYLIQEYLSESALKETGLYNVKFVLRQIDLFKANKLHYKLFIWKLLMFQMWYKRWMS